MPISLKCPKCRQSYRVKDELAGRRVQCKCGEAMAVPQPAAASEPAAAGASDPLSSLLDEEMPPAAEGPTLRSTVVAAGSGLTQTAPLPTIKPAKKTGLNPVLIGAIAGAAVVGVLLIVLVVVLMGGPGESEVASTEDTAEEGAVGGAKEPPAGFATPEEAFEAVKKAQIERDWAAHLRAFTPESQDNLVGGAALAAVMLAKSDPGVSQLFEKHGVDQALLKDAPSIEKPGDFGALVGQMQKYQKQLAAAIRDKPAFYVDMMRHMETVGQQMAEKASASLFGVDVSKIRAEAEKLQAAARLVDVKIDGDTAVGSQTFTFQGRTFKTPVHFRRINGRWFVHQPTLQLPGQRPSQPPPGGAPPP